ncbi:MAG TPA: 2,3-bisphosphoglycerate-independent phosphoglycerate mutase [Candidatus Babeliales bacterium]|jgi:2,3-bisphosphoglycerate-independent phosphoglycerate mutase|nr:2,3-bisphosphoglycerate-independent phosphoglycerate mutase [Candidatus Babeliales bacterium]
MHNNPVMLIILDGFGYSNDTQYNAIYKAQMPYFKQWMHEYPHALLHAAGNYVGLPDGYIGNSEVGHETIGAGRIIEQPITHVNNEIQNGNFFKDSLLQEKLKQLAKSGHALHIIGLLSDAGVHAHIEHMYAYMYAAVQAGIQRIYVHPILDGRDTKPCSAENFLTELQKKTEECGAIIASMHGRFYAMDRNANWDRTLQSYRVLTQKPSHITTITWSEVLETNYAQSNTDEFIVPTLLDPKGIVQPKDGIIFTNIRADRARQLTRCFIAPQTVPQLYKSMPLSFFITPYSYGVDIHTDILYMHPIITNTLKEVLSKAGCSLFSIAETEKYAHITYFFNGQKESSVPNEIRHLVPSKTVRDYSKLPAMSAPEITKAVLRSLMHEPRDFYLINYANPDMVGHSGNFDATVQALEIVDEQLGQLYAVAVLQMGGTLFITGDHGKAESMADPESGNPITAHTTNDVPFVIVTATLPSAENINAPLTQLADIAPCILTQMGIPVPPEMK